MAADCKMKDQADVAPPEIVSLEETSFPSIKPNILSSGASYVHFSDVPPYLLGDETLQKYESLSSLGPECMLGIDEAGRGPVLGPMVYGIFYLPLTLSDSLLRKKHQFDDSKVLTPTFRLNLMRQICTPETDLFRQCGWAVDVISAQDISSNMFKPTGAYNLNAQAMDATISLIKGVYERGVNVKEIYIDTIGNPETYQKKLEKIFPTANITVAKKADSLYPCVSAASVCAKVTRDVALEVLYNNFIMGKAGENAITNEAELSWGSGYPSDAKCTSWLKKNIHPVFGWGNECRFSWGTVKDLLDQKSLAVKVDWPDEPEELDTSRLTDYFNNTNGKDTDELATWFGTPVGTEFF